MEAVVEGLDPITEEAGMDEVDTSGKAFVEFWTLAAAKGDMNANTAGALRAAAKAVLENEPGWETLDVRTLDVDRLLLRFANRAATGMKQDSVRTYQRRFRQALSSYLEFVRDPAAWRPPAQQQNGGGKREPRKDRSAKPAADSTERAEAAAPTLPSAGSTTVDYPFPLRDGAVFARLKLPIDLTSEEAEQLHVFIKALVRPAKRAPAADA